jgi:hypothetical protein
VFRDPRFWLSLRAQNLSVTPSFILPRLRGRIKEGVTEEDAILKNPSNPAHIENLRTR